MVNWMFRVLNISIQGSSPSSVLSAARELNNLQELQQQKKKQQVWPKNIEKGIAYHEWKHGNPEARRSGYKKSTYNLLLEEKLLETGRSSIKRNLKVLKE